MAAKDSPERGIPFLYRVKPKRGKEYIRINSSGEHLPWTTEVVAKLEPHFMDPTKFYAVDETRGRKYGCPREWWISLPFEQLVKSCKYGRAVEV
ncbi:hypothetical protein [Nitrososphaera sp.]|uniref:hypothetical protein n=1 Tax=Nitrososphaera sp. TaxID=1971748 RepID=UPI00307F3122